MPTIEVSEEELARWPEYRRVAGVMAKLSAHPEARELVQKAVLIGDPESAGPEARLRVEFEERQKTRDQKLDEFLEEQRKEKEERTAAERNGALEREWRQSRSRAEALGYSGESLENLEKFMESRGVLDHEAGAALFEKLNPPPPPSINGSGKWNFFGPKSNDDSYNKALEDFINSGGSGDSDFLSATIPAAIAEVRGR